MRQPAVIKRQLTQTLAPLAVLAAAQARCRELLAEALAFYLLYGAKGDENSAGGEELNNGGEGNRERCDHSTDHEGSTDVITDSSGNIVWDGDYEAFGSVVRSNGTIRFDASYTGKEFDVDTGLYYFNARWYDPTLGRFITEDPARDGGNWFAYVGNNPMSRVDPNGLEEKYVGSSLMHVPDIPKMKPASMGDLKRLESNTDKIESGAKAWAVRNPAPVAKANSGMLIDDKGKSGSNDLGEYTEGSMKMGVDTSLVMRI